jgi:hypothetical protein
MVGAVWFKADAIGYHNRPVTACGRIDLSQYIVPYIHSGRSFREIHKLVAGDRAEMVSNRSRESLGYSRISQNQHLLEA